MTAEQRRRWAEAVVKHEPPDHLHTDVSYEEASQRITSLTIAAAQTGCWKFLAQHIVILHNEMLKKSKR